MQEAYTKFKAAWEAGDRTREDSLRLMFLAWMHWADPSHLTGLCADAAAPSLWRAIFEHFGGETSADPEFLYAAGIMANLFPWMLGDEHLWEERADRMLKRADALRPSGFTSRDFEGREDFGDYFAHQARSEGN